jgi:ribosomal RNA-processing protein 9
VDNESRCVARYRPICFRSVCPNSRDHLLTIVVGSWDGVIRLWALNSNFRSFTPANFHSIPLNGFINALHFISLPTTSIHSSDWQRSGSVDIATPDADDSEKKVQAKQSMVLAAAVAQEPRLGRWIRLKDGVRNGAFLIHVQLDDAGSARL